MNDVTPTGRVAEVAMALALATDLGTGQPMEQGLRTCWLALRVAEALGLDNDLQSCVFYVALLRFLGCTADASETAALAGGDDLAFNQAMAPALGAGGAEATTHLARHLAEGLPVPQRMGRVAAALSHPGAARRSLTGHCEVGARLATRLGMSPVVTTALAHAYERWDGKGYPDGLSGEAVPVAVRVVAAARDAEIWERTAGWPDAADTLARRRGKAYDPTVVDVIVALGPEELHSIDDDPWSRVVEAEPRPVATLDPSRLDDALGALADFADMKSPFLLGHSTGVANLAGSAGRAAGLPVEAVTNLRRAGLVHDLGRVGVPSGIWDQPGPLRPEQWERVRLHPYLTDRVLQRSDVLAPYAVLAARHHERIDGSGYPRGAAADELSVGATVLAAADSFHAMTQTRPHRPALGGAEAAATLLDMVDDGRLPRRAVEAVLHAAGEQSRPPDVARPAGLTEREVDVLRLIARGRTNKQVAGALGISAKTVGHHVESIYAKARLTTRAGATLFALENRLLTPDIG